MSACHAIGNGWEWWQELQPKMDAKRIIFSKAVDLSSPGPVRLRLNGKEEYLWNKVGI